MVATPSTMRKLGIRAPDFQIPDTVTGETVSLDQFRDKKGLLIMFLCRHCKYVQHVKHELVRLGRDYAHESLGIVAISSNDIELYPDDAPDMLKEMAQELGFAFPLCYDESQEVAKSYDAACTPDFFLYDEDRELVYRGQLDDSRPLLPIPVTGKDLRTAIDALLAGSPIPSEQKPSIGCNIKWRPGNEQKG